MLKVLYLINHAGKGGSENYVFSLIERLHGKEAECFLAYNEHGPLVDRVGELGGQSFHITMRNPFDMKAAKELAQLCRTIGVDVVHSQFLRENYIAVLSKTFNPKVRTIYTSHIPMTNNLVTKVFNRAVTSFNDGVIAVYSKGAKLLEKNWTDAGKIKVIFNSVNTGYWSSPEPSTIRQELGINEKEFVIACMARFTEEKGQKFLIEALRRLKEITPGGFKCILGGDGPLLEDCKKMAADYGLGENVIFTGYRQDIKNIYYGIDLYVSPSSNEAMSYSILEALACGVPVIATNVGGSGDIISPDTGCGVLVEYGDVEGLTIAINKMMTDLYFYNTIKGRTVQTVRERFDIDIMVRETYNLYRKS